MFVEQFEMWVEKKYLGAKTETTVTTIHQSVPKVIIFYPVIKMLIQYRLAGYVYIHKRYVLWAVVFTSLFATRKMLIVSLFYRKFTPRI